MYTYIFIDSTALGTSES